MWPGRGAPQGERGTGVASWGGLGVSRGRGRQQQQQQWPGGAQGSAASSVGVSAQNAWCGWLGWLVVLSCDPSAGVW
ncbi:hypothetical protein E2C01_050247 [Portunus trituberculatus]|uniref:Uncharacterized protein n=1 Tax=Portunus trituberculatus TaxID=210409 RepID=A0A5B7GFY2_PORTR|nr:hypothetical protein [Portunus trituberculatus]